MKQILLQFHYSFFNKFQPSLFIPYLVVLLLGRLWCSTQVLRVFHSGVPLEVPARHPLSLSLSLSLCSYEYVTLGLVVVDRTLRACPVTCSSRHLTSRLFHSYISTAHSLHPQACASFSLCVLGQYRLRAWPPGVLRQRESHRLVAIRVGQDRDTIIELHLMRTYLLYLCRNTVYYIQSRRAELLPNQL